MAHRFPPMTVANVERPDPTTVVVVVEHDAAQSYSRAVTPFAMRHAGAAIGRTAASWTLTKTGDRGTVPAGEPVRRGTRCLTAYIYRETAAHAREEAAELARQYEDLPEVTPEELAHLFGPTPAPAEDLDQCASGCVCSPEEKAAAAPAAPVSAVWLALQNARVTGASAFTTKPDSPTTVVVTIGEGPRAAATVAAVAQALAAAGYDVHTPAGANVVEAQHLADAAAELTAAADTAEAAGDAATAEHKRETAAAALRLLSHHAA